MNTLIDVALAYGHLKTLAKALTAAGLIETLKGAGPFTVFAPTDDAFAKLPAGTVEGLLKDVPKLTAVLKYHVLSGKVAAADVMKLDGKTATTPQWRQFENQHHWRCQIKWSCECEQNRHCRF